MGPGQGECWTCPPASCEPCAHEFKTGETMRFVLGYGLNDIHHMADVAKAAEAAGFDSFTFGDSLFYPKHTDSIYPYKGGDRSFLENIDFLDPTAAIASL